MTAARPFARFALCGMISQYNATDGGAGIRGLIQAVGKSLRLEGFIVSNHFDMMPAFVKDLAGWVAAGKISWQETVEARHRERPDRVPEAVQGREPGQDAGEAELTANAGASWIGAGGAGATRSAAPTPPPPTPPARGRGAKPRLSFAAHGRSSPPPLVARSGAFMTAASGYPRRHRLHLRLLPRAGAGADRLRPAASRLRAAARGAACAIWSWATARACRPISTPPPPRRVLGRDFNPVHAANAQASGAHLRAPAPLHRRELRGPRPPRRPAADGLHRAARHLELGLGRQRRNIVEIIRKRLKVGGAVYMSYNTLPGWAVVDAAAPADDAARRPGRAATCRAVVDAHRRAYRLRRPAGRGRGRATSPPIPPPSGRLDAIAGQNRNYLAHEYFNRDLDADVLLRRARRLAGARPELCGRPSLIDQMDGLNLTGPQRELLDGIPAGVLRETVRDYLLNTSSAATSTAARPRALSPLEKLERLGTPRIALSPSTPAAGERSTPTSARATRGPDRGILRPGHRRPGRDGAAAEDHRRAASDRRARPLPPGPFLDAWRCWSARAAPIRPRTRRPTAAAEPAAGGSTRHLSPAPGSAARSPGWPRR